jgi:hypothetical protein
MNTENVRFWHFANIAPTMTSCNLVPRVRIGPRLVQAIKLQQAEMWRRGAFSMNPIITVLTVLVLSTVICSEGDAKDGGGSKGQKATSTQKSPSAGFSASSSFSKTTTTKRRSLRGKSEPAKN